MEFCDHLISFWCIFMYFNSCFFTAVLRYKQVSESVIAAWFLTDLNQKPLYPSCGNRKDKEQIPYWCQCVCNGQLGKDCKSKVKKLTVYNVLVCNWMDFLIH